MKKRCLKLFKNGKAVLVCPEQLGGLTTPRKPAEIVSSLEEKKVVNNEGIDVTQQFVKGAEETLKIAKALGVKKAILKEGSPSCGCNYIYDGTFSGVKIPGKGVTAELLEREGIAVFSEEDIEVNTDKLVYLNEFNRERAKKRKLFEADEEDEYYEEEYYDLTDSLQDSEDLPESVEKNVKRLMVSLAKDLMGFEEDDEIAEATGLQLEEVQKILEENQDQN